jgi:hypothetical protein
VREADSSASLRNDNKKNRQRQVQVQGQRTGNDKSKCNKKKATAKSGCTAESGGGVVAAWARFDVADVYVLPFEGGGVVFEGGFGGF